MTRSHNLTRSQDLESLMSDILHSTDPHETEEEARAAEVSGAAMSAKSTARRAFLTRVRRVILISLLRNRFLSATLTRLIADLIFGKSFTSCELINMKYSTMNYFKMQGQIWVSKIINVEK